MKLDDMWITINFLKQILEEYADDHFLNSHTEAELKATIKKDAVEYAPKLKEMELNLQKIGEAIEDDFFKECDEPKTN